MSVNPLNPALNQAVQQQNIGAIASLSAQNADVNNLDQGRSPLYSAVEGKNPKVVLTLIHCKANVNLVFSLADMDGEETTALHEAAFLDQIEILNILLRHRADVTLRETSGRSALHWAAMHAHELVLMLLLEYGSDPDMQDNRENTPLHFIAGDEAAILEEDDREGIIEPLIRTLVYVKANVNALNKDGDTPLALLAKRVEKRRARGVDWRDSWPSETFLSLVRHGAGIPKHIEIPEHIEAGILELHSPLPISKLRLFMVELDNTKRQKPNESHE